MGTRRIRSRGAGPGRTLGRTVAAALLAGAATLAACSTPAPPPPAQPSPTPDERLARLVPEAVRQDGKLTVGTDPSYPPMEFATEDGAGVQGADVDLISAIATVLELTPDFAEEAFTALPTSVRTGRVEVGMSSLTVRGERQLTDAVLYYLSGTQLVRSDSAPELTRATMCGERIAVLEGSYQVINVKQASQRCLDQGLPRITIDARSNQAEVTRAALSASVAGMMTDIPVAQYTVRRDPTRLQLAGASFARAPLGILSAPELPRLARAIRGALQQLMDSGYYGRVLSKWGITLGAVDVAQISWSDQHERSVRRRASAGSDGTASARAQREARQ